MREVLATGLMVGGLAVAVGSCLVIALGYPWVGFGGCAVGLWLFCAGLCMEE